MLCGSGAREAPGSAWGVSCGSAGAGAASSARTDIGPAAPTAPRIVDRSTFARNSEADEARTFVRSKYALLYPQCIAQIRMLQDCLQGEARRPGCRVYCLAAADGPRGDLGARCIVGLVRHRLDV